MGGRNCHKCIYSICDPELWLRCVHVGEPIVPRCANHPMWPGQLHDVPGVPCRNYRPKASAPKGENVRLIPLTHGCYAYVDAGDYEWLNQWHWRAYSTGYAARWEEHKLIYMHRQIMKPPRGKIVDHINGNGYDNTRANMRNITPSQNMYNKGKHIGTASMYKGVCYDKRRRQWYSQIRFGKERFYLGYVDTELEAARAYDHMAVELFGEFAGLNLPQEWPAERRAQVHAQWQKDRRKTRGKSNREDMKAPRGAARKKPRIERRRKTKARR
jgi:hypothetical protein